ncbi:hypothetical protein [Nocardioides sp. ChNu-99]|uniref:hypothetical protein n=1 Tax=Nocardioides sp. ChNu-99 TaxID=2839897 RepID=UPI0024055834|nr:hypothetical protein [Nocardioides sp. ChNu-99]MDF9717245.1 hypothetical protein [Nocardioides sp. ChNu-99]
MTRIAGVVDLATVMTNLSQQRPVFHSEADFQFALAQAVAAADSSIEVRLEVRQPAERAEYVDIVCQGPQRRTFIELKYATASWLGEDGRGEQFQLKNHAAYDLARRYFIHDVHRLERFTEAVPDADGVALMLTNEPGLWNPPTGRVTRDTNFRVHEGRTLTGHLAWGSGDTPRYDQNLTGTYAVNWHDYSELDGGRGLFRWLALPVGSAS